MAEKALRAIRSCVEAQELLARLALEDNDDAKAVTKCQEGAQDVDPIRVQAKAILATIDWLADKGKEPTTARDPKIRPNADTRKRYAALSSC